MPALWLGSVPRLTTYTHPVTNTSTLTNTVVPSDLPRVLPDQKAARHLSPGLYRRLSQ